MQRTWLQCLAPVLGIFTGWLVGWIIHATVHPTGITDFAIRFFVLVFSVSGWAVATVLQNKKLYCGGTQVLDRETRHRYFIGMWPALIIVVLSPFFLLTHIWYIYFPCIFLLL